MLKSLHLVIAPDFSVPCNVYWAEFTGRSLLGGSIRHLFFNLLFRMDRSSAVPECPIR
jgi:hypothetical protein